MLGAYATAAEELEEESKGPAAILAIEIVDPTEKTDGKNAKRTIESSLGYGYQNSVHSTPKFERYKYSQHDIPAYSGVDSQYQNSGKKFPKMYVHLYLINLPWEIAQKYCPRGSFGHRKLLFKYNNFIVLKFAHLVR